MEQISFVQAGDKPVWVAYYINSGATIAQIHGMVNGLGEKLYRVFAGDLGHEMETVEGPFTTIESAKEYVRKRWAKLN